MKEIVLPILLFFTIGQTSFAATSSPSPLCSQNLVTAFRQAKQRIIAIDYDRTIRKHGPFERLPSPSTELLSLLQRIASLPNTLLIINSARPKELLEIWFRSVPAVGLAAENGFWYRPPNGNWKISKPNVDTSFYPPAVKFLRGIRDYVWGSELIVKTASITFVHRELEPQLGPKLARDLELIMSKHHQLKFRALHNRKAVEFLPVGVDKGTLIADLLTNYSQPQETFILVAGDDEADEDAFRAALHWSPSAWTIQIQEQDSGLISSPTSATWTLSEVESFLKLLESLSN